MPFSSHTTATCFLLLSDISTNPPTICPNYPFSLSWYVLVGEENSDAYRATFTFNDNTYTSDFVRTSPNSYTFMAPINYSDFWCSNTISDKLYPMSILVEDTKTLCADYRSDFSMRLKSVCDKACLKLVTYNVSHIGCGCNNH